MPEFPETIADIIGRDVQFETRPGRFTPMRVLDVRWVDPLRGSVQFNLRRLSDKKARWTTEYLL